MLRGYLVKRVDGGEDRAADDEDDLPQVCNNNFPEEGLLWEAHKEEPIAEYDIFVIETLALVKELIEYVDREANDPDEDHHKGDRQGDFLVVPNPALHAVVFFEVGVAIVEGLTVKQREAGIRDRGVHQENDDKDCDFQILGKIDLETSLELLVSVEEVPEDCR